MSVQASPSRDAKNKRNGKLGLPSQTENPISAETKVPACERGRRISRCEYGVLVRSICSASMSAIEKICGGLFRSWPKQSLEPLFRALSVQYQVYVGIHVRPPL